MRGKKKWKRFCTKNRSNFILKSSNKQTSFSCFILLAHGWIVVYFMKSRVRVARRRSFEVEVVRRNWATHSLATMSSSESLLQQLFSFDSTLETSKSFESAKKKIVASTRNFFLYSLCSPFAVSVSLSFVVWKIIQILCRNVGLNSLDCWLRSRL